MIHLLRGAAALAHVIWRFATAKSLDLRSIRREGDALLARMQTPEGRAASKSAFDMPTAREARVLDEVIECTEELRSEMSIQQQREQALGFAYGNLAASMNHKPNVFAFWQVAQNDGWSKDDFEAWASEREWE